MQVRHESTAVFDEANLLWCAGLAPVLALAERAGLHDLLAEHLTLTGPGAANADAKAASLIAGMVVGADSIDDMDVLRHGAMHRLFEGVRAPSTLGTFLRSFTFGHVRQLDAVAARLLAGLSAKNPLLAGAEAVAYLDLVKPMYGYAISQWLRTGQNAAGTQKGAPAPADPKVGGGEVSRGEGL